MTERSPRSAPRGALADMREEARELEAFFQQQDPVDVAAAHWHTRQEQGLDAAEAAELAQWLASDLRHAKALARLDRGLDLLRAMPADRLAALRSEKGVKGEGAASHAPSLARGSAGHGAGRSGQPESRTHGAWPARALAWLWGGMARPATLALCCALVLAVGMGWFAWQQPTFTSSYATARGQRLNTALPDGSELTLDAETQASVALYRGRRELHMDEGQLMLHVQPDSARPFHVLAGAARITVVGTRFSVRYRSTGADAGAVLVAVEEGLVRVVGQAGTDAEGPPLALAAGQSVRVSATGSLGEPAAVSARSVAMWRQGLVHFENTPLADVLVELERYGPTQLVVRDPVVAAMPLGGSYPIGRPDSFARVLPQILPVRLLPLADGRTEIVRAP